MTTAAQEEGQHKIDNHLQRNRAFSPTQTRVLEQSMQVHSSLDDHVTLLVPRRCVARPTHQWPSMLGSHCHKRWRSQSLNASTRLTWPPHDSLALTCGLPGLVLLPRRYCNCEKELATINEDSDVLSRASRDLKGSLANTRLEAAKEMAAELSQYAPGPGKDLEPGRELSPSNLGLRVWQTHAEAPPTGSNGSKIGWRRSGLLLGLFPACLVPSVDFSRGASHCSLQLERTCQD